MDFTPKQERNGATGGTAAQDSAVPSTDITALVAATMGSATAMAAYTMVIGDPLVTNATVVDWETGIAGRDQPGEA